MERYCEEVGRAGKMGYLETDRPENVELYRRFGFEITDEAPVLGVPNFFMQRLHAANSARRISRRSNHARNHSVNDLHRCPWAGSDPLMRAYHDEEWGVPQRDSRMLWEMLMLEGFQAGLAWITVLRKRDAFRKAFAGFDPTKVAHFGERDVERLLTDPSIIRARAKIEAAIQGARIYLEMAERGESFSDFCWSFTSGEVLKGDGRSVVASSPLSERISKEMKRRGFKFVGPTIVYAWMQAVGIVNDHAIDCFRRQQTT